MVHCSQVSLLPLCPQLEGIFMKPIQMSIMKEILIEHCISFLALTCTLVVALSLVTLVIVWPPKVVVGTSPDNHIEQ
jgi:hypothetical protein